MAILFGRKQLKNPTPSKVGDFIQVFTVIAACVLAWIGTASFIPAAPSSVIQSILGLLIGIANGLKPFFGVKPEGKSVATEKVTEMEEPKTDQP